MQIYLSEERPSGKTETLKILCDQILNIYGQIITVSEISEEDQAFLAKIVVGKTTVILSEKSDLLDTVQGGEANRQPVIFVTEIKTDQPQTRWPAPGETFILKKEFRSNPGGRIIANIKDCEKILELISKGLAGVPRV